MPYKVELAKLTNPYFFNDLLFWQSCESKEFYRVNQQVLAWNLNIGQSRQNWKVEQSGQNWTICKVGQNWKKLDKIGPNWKVGQNWKVRHM